MKTNSNPTFARCAGLVAMCAAALITLVLAIAPARSLAQSDSKHPGTLESGGRTRTYFVHTPPGFQGDEKLPLVMVLHGGGGNADNAEKMSAMSDKADAANFLVVYPDGTGGVGDHFHTWNSGNCCAYAEKNNVDDVAFLRDLIDKMEYDYAADPKRIYVTGMSNGGMMAYRMGCEAADKIAAIAPVAGSMNLDCKPAQPISVIAFHGTADENVNYEGGMGAKQVGGPREDKPVATTIAFWVKYDGCPATPQKSEKGNLRTDLYAGCKDATAVELNSISGQGHAWPGSPHAFRMVADKPDPNVPATDMMWTFFVNHPKP